MEIRPILSALMRSKVALILIGVQIALTLAIVCNALFIINQRMEKVGRPSGMDEADTFTVTSTGFGADFNVQNAYAEDLSLLRGLPGVHSATSINTVPLSHSGWGEAISLTPDQKTATAGSAIYFVDQGGLDTYGLKLIAGRNFKPEEISFRDRNAVSWPPGLIITKALGEKLFPGQNPLGKQFYLDQKAAPNTVIGVVDRLQAPWPNSTGRGGDVNAVEYSTLIPQRVAYGNSTMYLVRADPGRRDELMKTVETKLAESNHSRVVRGIKSMQQVRTAGYRQDRAMMIILGIVIVSLLAITALGIVGMASFWVTQRTKQIGTRRALGASRGDILRYFHTENFIITTLGLIVGGVLTYAVSLGLMRYYESPRLPWYYVPIGFVCLWLLGQLAVLGPAARASRVPPAVATRTV
ncbi:MAG: FtsX-like permease family protein [Rhodanobacteraceae bacterium]